MNIVVIGQKGSGKSAFGAALSAELGLPVVDGVAAAVKLAESLVALGLTTSRVGSYAEPLPKRRVWGGPGGR